MQEDRTARDFTLPSLTMTPHPSLLLSSHPSEHCHRHLQLLPPPPLQRHLPPSLHQRYVPLALNKEESEAGLVQLGGEMEGEARKGRRGKRAEGGGVRLQDEG